MEDLKYSFSGSDIFHNSYLYDLNSNISSKTYQLTSFIDSYVYDKLNQIKVAELQGNFDYKTQTEDRTVGIVTDDVLGDKSIEEIIVDNEAISLDYRAGSIVADLQQIYSVTRVIISADKLDNRVGKKNLSIFFSSDNITYTEIPEWEYIRNGNGSIGLIFPTSIETRYIKVHSHFNNRDNDYNAINDSTFSARAKGIIQVYYTISTKIEKYDYDPSGNRILKEITIHSPRDQIFRYYLNSDRLMTDGTFVYQYDKNGNLLKKGELISIENVSINISDVDKEYWESVTSSIDSLSISPKGNYWEYDFDLLNQLTTVRKYDISTNSLETVAEYTYDSKGNRVLKEGKKKEIFILNQNGQILYEEIWDKESTKKEETSTYVYVFGKHFARIENNSDVRSVSYYHTDHLGSVVAVTDESGGLLWSNEYETFGGLSSSFNTFKHANKYTGKDFDEDTGLYYFNARWYDPELGRFISEDPIKDGVSWYVYCGNNPLVFIDPTGLETNYIIGDEYSWYNKYGIEDYIPMLNGLLEDNASFHRELYEDHTWFDFVGKGMAFSNWTFHEGLAMFHRRTRFNDFYWSDDG